MCITKQVSAKPDDGWVTLVLVHPNVSMLKCTIPGYRIPLMMLQDGGPQGMQILPYNKGFGKVASYMTWSLCKASAACRSYGTLELSDAAQGESPPKAQSEGLNCASLSQGVSHSKGPP